MKQLVSQAIILNRIDYGEADRILTVLTPDHGKLSVLAKGVRRVKSKLAGGIELFSVSDITFIQGRNGMGTLTSSRLIKHYGSIVANLERTMSGYELIKELNRATEDQTEEDYFSLLQQTFEALDDPGVPLPLIRLWFMAQLLRLGGVAPDLQHTPDGDVLPPGANYTFKSDAMAFAVSGARGTFDEQHIKFLRLAFAGYPAKVLAQVKHGALLTEQLLDLVQMLYATYRK